MADVRGVYSVQDYFTVGAAREIQQGKNMADAALGAGAEHFVFSSAGGAERKSGIAHFETKWEIENHIRKPLVRLSMGKEWYQMFRWLNKSGFQADIPSLRRDYPEVPLTSLEEWLRREGWQNKRKITVKRDSMSVMRNPHPHVADLRRRTPAAEFCISLHGSPDLGRLDELRRLVTNVLDIGTKVRHIEPALALYCLEDKHDAKLVEWRAQQEKRD
jgi:hypothetical protein